LREAGKRGQAANRSLDRPRQQLWCHLVRDIRQAETSIEISRNLTSHASQGCALRRLPGERLG
jgi:hypothetical protein